MKINWTQELHDIDGEAIPDTRLVNNRVTVKTDEEGNVVVLTLGRACINALLTELRDENQTGAQKFDRFKLAMQIANEPDKDVTAEDIALIKKRVGNNYVAYVVGTIWTILEGNDG